MIPEASKKIKEIEEKTFSDEDYNELPPNDIIAFNELRSCADLFRMYEKKILEIQPEFQREVVWGDAQQTRFIDSLMKQLPIPSMCLSLDYKTQKWKVIDGLQRISTIIRFLKEENNWKLSKLTDIDPRISGKYISDIKNDPDNHILFERVENLTIPLNVLRCDYSKENHTIYLFTIFHRLNTGGVKLNNQEIRNSLYSGSFNNMLKECNKNNIWRKLLNLKDNKIYRFTKEELILRFFSFYYNGDNYDGTLSKFLNDYMHKNKNMAKDVIELNKTLFNDTINLINSKITEGATLGKSSNSFIEALLYGVAMNLDFLQVKSNEDIQNMFSNLVNDENFSEVNLSEGLYTKTKVERRLHAAETIFGG